MRDLARLAAAVGALMTALASGDAAANNCRPHRGLPPVLVRDGGVCGFDRERLAFAGDPATQASCLLRAMDGASLAPGPVAVPENLARRLGSGDGLPDERSLRAAVQAAGMPAEFAAALALPVSRAGDGDPAAPAARYLVFHDTSGPRFGSAPFPVDLDVSAHYNALEPFACPDDTSIAHAVVARDGRVFAGHDFATPWRATKFERGLGDAVKGLFLHVELIQPRRGVRGDIAPRPAFTQQQYERAALLYAIASRRAGVWLVPAFHAAIDASLPDGHDDPRGFDVAAFSAALDRLLAGGEASAAPDGR